MKNRIVGFIVLGVVLLMGFIIYSFNRALTQMVTTTCSHGSSCPMWGTLNFQTNVSIGIMVFVALVGVYLIFSEKIHKTTKKEVKSKKDYSEVLKDLTEEEKQVFQKILDEDGSVFQSNIVEETGLAKVKVTRILDRLEGQGLIERKRRGMTNIVVLKH